MPVLSAVLAAALAAAPPCVEPPPDPANTYDAPHTYAKLVRDYPAIEIATATPPPAITQMAEQVYAQYGSRCLKLDAYMPPGARLPAVIFVHGGGWKAGYRSEFVPMALRLAQHGYVGITVSYRLSGEARYPAAVQDVQAAVRWVRAHADALHIDPQRIALAGGSAGGQIAALAGLTAGPDAAVQAIINIDGLSDFTSALALRYEDDPAKRPSAAGAWFGGSYAEQPALWRAASPINYVGPGMPPILFIGSGQPRFSAGREAMRAQMAAVGAASEQLVLPGTPHAFWLFDPWLQTTVDASVAFLHQQLR